MRCGLLLLSILVVVSQNLPANEATARQGQAVGPGQLLVIEPQSGATVRLNLARQHVHVVLRPPVALVQIDQSFFNPFPFQLGGTFVFNLPAGASISRFALYATHTQLVEGELIDRGHQVPSGQPKIENPTVQAILDQIGGNQFRMEVFPIFPRDTKRILLDYTVPLVDQEGGRYTFELPLVSELDAIGDFALSGAIHGPTVAGSAASQSHPDLKFEEIADETLRFRFAKAAYRPESAFALTFQQRQAIEPVVRSYAHPVAEMADESEGKAAKEKPKNSCEFVASISSGILEKRVAPRRTAALPVDVLLAIDTSAANLHPQATRKTAQQIVSALRQNDRFQIGCVDVGFRPLSKTWLIPASPEAAQVFSALDREFCLGAFDAGASLRSAFEALPKAVPGRHRLVIYVGDGRLAAGKATPNDFTARLPQLAVQADLRFGAVVLSHDAAGRALLDRLAAATAGRVFRVGGPPSLKESLAWFSTGCSEPIKIVEAHAEDVAEEDLFAPAEWIPGSTVHVYGRRNAPGKFKLRLTIELDGRREPFEWSLEARDDQDDLFTGRLWAQFKLDQLLAQTAEGDSFKRLHERQVALSQEWSLLCPQTAFLLLGSAAEDEKYGVRRSRRRRYWPPAVANSTAPINPENLQHLKAPRPIAGPISAEQFHDAIAEARRAVKNLAPDLAVRLLKVVEGSEFAAKSAEFAKLRDEARQMLARADLFEKLGSRRGWFDRSHPIGFSTTSQDLVWQLVYGAGTASESNRPLAALFRPIAPPRGEMSLEDFIAWVKLRSGLNILINRGKLADEGIAVDQPVDPVLHGIRSMTLQSMLMNVLAPAALTYEIEDDVLTVTTAGHAAERLDTRFYPIGDLILSTQVVPHSLLSNAELDRRMLVDQRLEQKLNQKIAVDFNELPLEDVLEFFAAKLDDNFVIDRSKINDEGISLDQPITLDLRDVPVRRILKSLLEPLGLSTHLANEAIVVTTSQSCADKLQTQIHAAQDIVYELPPELQKPPRRMKLADPLVGRMSGASHAGRPDSALGQSELVDVPDSTPNTAAPPIQATALGMPLTAALADSPVDRPAAATENRPSMPGQAVRRRTNAQEMIELIQSAIQPDSWEDLSGPGSVMYNHQTLGFVVRQTQAVHAELAEFLERYRALPVAFGEQSGLTPARVRLVGANDLANWDAEGFVHLLTSTIQPDSWEELSGPGSVLMNKTKLTLVIRQTQAIHEEISTLLTSLRRARYLARRGQIWKTFDVAAGPWFPVALGVTDLPESPAESKLPAPDAAELSALKSLAEPIAGEQTWRSTAAAGGKTHTTVLRIAPDRQEYELDERVTRVEGEEAAVAYPGLSLVERGRWGTSLRRIVDGRLPWLPHRSHLELAKLFVVQMVAQDKQTTQLRLSIPEGSLEDDILVTIDRQTRLPTLWEARLAGQPILRLRFADQRRVTGKPMWGKVIAEDAAGRNIETWELTRFAELKPEIPALDDGWRNSVVLDLRVQDSDAKLPDLVAALQAVRSGDREAADRGLAAVLAKYPRQPLASFLKAWHLSQQPRHDKEIVALLTDVARSGAGDLIRNIADGAFVHVSADDMYSVLQHVPELQRTPADWDYLARMATRIGKTDAAIHHLKTALKLAGSEHDSPERIRLLVHLLLETDQLSIAVELARSRVLRDEIVADEIVALSDALARAGVKEEAHQLVAAALANPRATGTTRQKLLSRRADFETGIARWRTLIAAGALLPDDSRLRPESIAQIVREVQAGGQPDVAGPLAEQTKDQEISTALWLAQAEFDAQHTNPNAAADICWKLYEARQLPAERFEWCIAQLQAARQHERVIWIIEDQLHTRHAVDPDVLHSILPAAYEAVGRKDAAARARTQPRPPEPDPNRPPRPGPMRGMGAGFFDLREPQ